MKTQEVTQLFPQHVSLPSPCSPLRSERCTRRVRWVEPIIRHHILFQVGPVQARGDSACMVCQGAPKPSDMQKMRQTTALHPTRQTTAVLQTQLLPVHSKSTIWNRDFLGGPLVENPPSMQGRKVRIPSQGTKIPHAPGQPSPYTPTEPTRHSERSHVT